MVVVIIYVVALVRFRRSKLGEDHIPEQVEGSQHIRTCMDSYSNTSSTSIAVPTVYYTYKLGDVSAMGAVDEEGNAENLSR